MQIINENTFDFVLCIMRRLFYAQIATWLHGGWAEELREMYLPRSHRDVDLLYPAPNFDRLDVWLAATAGITEIPAKRFSHKRAFLCQSIMIEVFLLEADEKRGYQTNFFNKGYQFVWPHDTLDLISVRGQDIPVASSEALRQYRDKHQHIVDAYQMYLPR